MGLKCFRITDGTEQTLEPCQFNVENWRQGTDSYWVDLCAQKPAELEAFLADLGISELAKKCCREAGPASRFIPLPAEIFWTLLLPKDGSGFGLTFISFLCFQDMVVTLHPDTLSSLDKTFDYLMNGHVLDQPTTSDLACVIMLLHSTASLHSSEELKQRIIKLDQLMDDDPDKVEADQILDKKRLVRTQELIVQGQRECFDLLVDVDRPYLNLQALKSNFQFAVGNAHIACQIVEGLEKTVADNQQRFEVNQQDLTNRRLAVLTIVSTIFIPLTFIGGIYGMNFANMPWLNYSHAYEITMGGMALIAGGMFVFFKKNGWLD